MRRRGSCCGSAGLSRSRPFERRPWERVESSSLRALSEAIHATQEAGLLPPSPCGLRRTQSSRSLSSGRPKGRTRWLLAMTAERGFTFSRRDSPELCYPLPPSKIRGRREDRVRAAPAVPCAIAQESAHTSIQVQRRASGLPCAMALRLIRDLPGEPSSLATVTSQITSAKLGASFGRQDHTTSPYAQAARVSRSISVHRTPPHVRDDRERPSEWDGMASHIG